MQNVTRTIYKYVINAYDMIDDADGMRIEVVANCHVVSPMMSKTIARRAIEAETGQKPKRGVSVKWKRIGTITYAMPADEFFKNAVIVSEENI